MLVSYGGELLLNPKLNFKVGVPPLVGCPRCAMISRDALNVNGFCGMTNATETGHEIWSLECQKCVFVVLVLY